MTWLALFLQIVAIGVITWGVVTYIPLPKVVKSILIVIAVVIIGWLALDAFGVIDAVSGVKVPRVSK